MEKACKMITQPWMGLKYREERDYFRRNGYVKAVRITQTPQTTPVSPNIPPFTHPYQRSVRGIAFFGNNNCKGEPKLIIWPKQAMDMNYPTTRRYEILRSPTEIENFYYKWAQTFEFSDFDVKKDPNSHYNLARPQFWDAMDPEDTKAIEDFLLTYQENAYLKKNTIGSPMGTPYHQAFGSFREIYPTRSDRIWRQIVSPASSDTSYWDIPMINVQLDHRIQAEQQKSAGFFSFVPYGLADSSRATIFAVIEQEYARFYKLMVDLLGVPSKSWLRRSKWSRKRQEAAITKLAFFSDPLSPFHTETVKSLERVGEKSLSSLQPYEVYTSSPLQPDPREWMLPPSWLDVPIWNPEAKFVKSANGERVPVGAYQKVPNPNRIIYSSVQINWQPNGEFVVQTVPVMSNPISALKKEAIVLLEELPYTGVLSQSSVRAPIIPDARPPGEVIQMQIQVQQAVMDKMEMEDVVPADIPTRQRANAFYSRRPPIQPAVQPDIGLDIPTRQRATGLYSRPPSLGPQGQLVKPNSPISMLTRQRSKGVYSRPADLFPNRPAPDSQINIGTNLRTRPISAAMSEEELFSSAVFSPANTISRGSWDSLIGQPQGGASYGGSGGTAGTLSSIAGTILEESQGKLREGDMDIEDSSKLIDDEINSPLRDLSQTQPPLRIKKLADSQISLRPQDLLESTNSLLQSRRQPKANEIEFLKDSVVNYRPPPTQNLRENILMASQHPNANGDIVVPVGEDVNGLRESIVINTKNQAGKGKAVAPVKGSGTGKKDKCIVPPEEARLAKGVCSVLICCNS
ncbi:hypothetical protein ABW20_dc0108141 [Dactylellina cionopaga]|nr:hypothetical protein ABW20_dc0108141 [Dactylellina cionopaga]